MPIAEGALATIATYATIAAAATSVAGTVYASQQKGPKLPDGASSSKKVADAQAMALPDQLKLQQLQQQGGKGTVNMPAHQEQRQFVKVPKGSSWESIMSDPLHKGALSGPVGGFLYGHLGLSKKKKKYDYLPYDPKDFQEGGKYAGQQLPGEIVEQTVDVPYGPGEVDFTGYGTADIEGRKARDQADLELELGQKYGTQFADLARQNAEAADPLGTKARAMEYDLINKDMAVSPLSGTLNDQILSQVKAGRGLDAGSRELLDKAITDANASRGGRVMAGDVAGSMSTGAEGQARLDAAISKSGGFMASGQTPEDIAFRRTQQKMTNLGSFVNGATPESQFGNISRSSQGSTPVTGAQPNAAMPNNAGQVGTGYATSAYASNANNAANSTNSWFAGLSGLLSGIGSLKTAKG